MNIYIQNKGYLIKEFLVFFLLAFITRLSYVYIQNPVPEKLIEDELLYWNASLLYLEKGYLENSLLSERMLGIFIYVKTLLVLSLKNLKLYLLQSILDALTCIIIYKTGSLVIPKQKIYPFFLSSFFTVNGNCIFSGIIRDYIFIFFTIFLFFKITLLKYLFFNMAIAGLFLVFHAALGL